MPENETESKVIYGDGRLLVSMTGEDVKLCDGDQCIAMSRRAFEEVVLGYQRQRERGEEA